MDCSCAPGKNRDHAILNLRSIHSHLAVSLPEGPSLSASPLMYMSTPRDRQICTRHSQWQAMSSRKGKNAQGGCQSNVTREKKKKKEVSQCCQKDCGISREPNNTSTATSVRTLEQQEPLCQQSQLHGAAK